MDTKILGLLLPVVFILHNIEEYRSFEDFKAFYFKTIHVKLRHRKVFGFALLILTLLVSLICIANYLATNSFLGFATTIVAMSLLINGIQHSVCSCLARKLLPGTISAIFLLIPCSIVYLAFLEKETQFGISSIISWSLVSVVSMFVSIHISLWIGYFFFKRSFK